MEQRICLTLCSAKANATPLLEGGPLQLQEDLQAMYAVSAVGGGGIKELAEALWQKVKELK